MSSVSKSSKRFVSNSNRTSCRPIRSVIIRVINKIGRPRSGSPICLITSMITDRIGRHEVVQQFSLWMKSYGVTIQIKPLQQYFHMVLFI